MINGNTEKAFNAKSVYGYGTDYAQILNNEMKNTNGKSGLNNAETVDKSIKNDVSSPNMYEIGNLAGYGYDILRTTKYKPTIIDKLQYAQPQKQGYSNNRDLKILESIEQTRKPATKHNVIGLNTPPSIDYGG